jgi:hypothetical protein
VEVTVMTIVTRRQSAGRLLALAVLAIGMAACTNAAATTSGGPPPTQSSAAPTASFRSALYGYSVAYPAGWTVTAATKPWTAGANDPSDPGVSDVFQSPGKARVEIAVQAVPNGWDAARWEGGVLPDPVPSQMAACFPDPAHWTAVDIGGRPGGLLGGVSWCGFTEGVVVIGQRGYVVKGVVDPTTLTADSFDRGVLDRMFSSLTPAPT